MTKIKPIIKTCKICNFIGDIFLFKGKKCKKCVAAAQREYNKKNKNILSEKGKKRYQKNKERITTRNINYVISNLEKTKEYQKQYAKNNKDEIKLYQKEYRKNNPPIIDLEKKRKNGRIWQKKKRETDPAFKLRQNVSFTINKILKSNGSSKRGRSISEFLPYTFDQLKIHLEKQFEPWMNWSNHGKYHKKLWNDSDCKTWTWHIDHIISKVKLPHSCMQDENFQKCWALSNLRPLSAKQNVLDGVR